MAAPPPPLADAEHAAVYPPTLALALLAFHRTVGPIRKESQAKYGAFADLRTVLDAITPPLLEQGLVLSQCMDAAADGASLLRTELTHAPTGERLCSTCLVPSLQALLDRVHELRTEALRHYPFDLELAAIGALPPLLPPRSPEPSAELPPPAPRQPGLRIDDQLKGLYTLLGQLGTTSNPLHALGGIVTYLRRYQILTLLCLAPADDDGGGERHGPVPAQAASSSSGTTSRSRRSSRSEPKTPPRPHPTPAPAAPAAQSPQPAQPTATAPQPAAAAQDPQPQEPTAHAPVAQAPGTQPPSAPAAAEPELSAAEVQQLIGLIRTLPSERVATLAQAFRDQFGLKSNQLVSDYIKTATHAAFIREQVNRLQGGEAPI